MLVAETLHAERDAIDARLAVAPETFRFHTGRVGLQRDFGVAGNRPVRRDGVENARHRSGLHQRGRAATEEDRVDRAFAAQRAHMGEFALIGLHEDLLVNRLVADMAVEIAIGALGRAERPVDIHAERVAGSHCICRAHAPRSVLAPSFCVANSAKARARWERPRSPRPASQPCFSPASISPKVRSKPSGRKTGS